MATAAQEPTAITPLTQKGMIDDCLVGKKVVSCEVQDSLIEKESFSRFAKISNPYWPHVAFEST
jgi:hypothetical protein